MTRVLWPVAEAAQSDYEQLRAWALAGTPAVGRAAAVFERRGMWGLIASPQAVGKCGKSGNPGRRRVPRNRSLCE